MLKILYFNEDFTNKIINDVKNWIKRTSLNLCFIYSRNPFIINLLRIAEKCMFKIDNIINEYILLNEEEYKKKNIKIKVLMKNIVEISKVFILSKSHFSIYGHFKNNIQNIYILINLKIWKMDIVKVI